MVEVLLEYGVAIDAQNNYCCTPLGFASMGYRDHDGDDPRIARFLIERGADPNISVSSDDGSTPLHGASEGGRIEVARVLLEHGANVEVKDKKGRTPLDVASEGQREEIVKLLLEHGARREDIVP